MRELLSNNSLFVGQLYEDKSLAPHARDLIFFTRGVPEGKIKVRRGWVLGGGVPLPYVRKKIKI